MNRLLAILCCLISLPAIAQTLKGKVTDKATGQPLFPVTVVNLSTQKSTYTSTEGYYTIQAEAGDKIAFSYIGYKAVQYQMPISVGTYTTDISMQTVSYQLREVILMPDYTEYQVDSIERVQKYRPFLSRTKSNAIASPFSFVAEKFNKRSKQIFKFQKNFGKWETERYIDTRYTPELVEEMTGMSGDSVGYFMNAYPMPYDYARSATELELKMWVRYHHREWLKVVDSTGLPVISDSLINEIK